MTAVPLDPLGVALSGTNLIEASAGTGKTHNITTLYLRLVVEQGLGVEQILVVTFTEAATSELRDRIRTSLRRALEVSTGREPDGDTATLRAVVEGRPEAATRLERALVEFDQAAVFTIHGFCNRMLHENAFESGTMFDTELIADQRPLLDDVLDDFWAREVSIAPAALVRILQQRGVTPSTLSRLVHMVTARPDRLLLPESVPDSGETLHAVDEISGRLRALVEREGVAVEALLKAHEGSLHKPFKRSWPDKLKAAREELASGRPVLPAKNHWVKTFSSDHVRKKTLKGKSTPEHPFFDACQDCMDLLPRIDEVVLGFELRLAAGARDELRRRKQAQNLCSYDDMLQRLLEALDGADPSRLARAIRTRYRAALVDEFQDTDTIQYRIFQLLFGDGGVPVFQIGDPKQSIFAFRGADIYSYLRAAREADRHYTLETNWRSDPGLVEAVNFLFARLAEHMPPFLVDKIAYRPVGPRPGAYDACRRDGVPAPPMVVRFIQRAGRGEGYEDGKKLWADRHLAGLVAGEIAAMLAGEYTLQQAPHGAPRRIRAGDIAVLVRKNDQARDLQQALHHLGVPSVLTAESSVFATSEADELARVLAAVADPGDGPLVRAALATGLLGLDGLELYALNRDAGGEARWEAWVQRLVAWRRSWEMKGFASLFGEVMAMCQVRQMEIQDGERRVTNLRHLGELLQAAATEGHLGVEGLLRWFGQRRAAPSSEADAAQLRLESDADAVRLVTVFKAKGLQYPVVFCPFFWDGYLHSPGKNEPVAFHDPGDRHRAKLDLTGSARSREQAVFEARAESMRLLYVALTRARHLCVAHWGWFNDVESAALGRLLHGPLHTPEEMKKLDDATLLGELRDIESASGGTVEVQQVALPSGTAGLGRRPGTRPDDLSPRIAGRVLRRELKTSSYTRLLGEARPAVPGEDEGRDHDEHDTPGSMDAATAGTGPGPVPAGDRVVLADFERGARAGSFLHAVFEHIDFAAGREAHAAIVSDTARAFGFDPAEHPCILQAVGQVLDTSLDAGLKLGGLRRGRTLREMEFLFPARCRGPELAQAFGRHPGGPVGPSYHERLSALGLGDVRGFLKGFVDLVFEHDGRWYLVDYKSNHLGVRYADYQQARLAEAMVDHHYVLQYHLYLVALHRYLRLRLADYDYDRHMGGAFYLFVRGMSPALGPRCGVFGDRPRPELIEELDVLLGGGRAS